MRRLLLALLFFVMPWSAPAQMLLHADGPLPSFEVVSIKPGTFWAGAGPLGSSQTVWLALITTRELIATAYGQHILVGRTHLRVFGGPDWIDHDHYSAEAKIPDDIFGAMKTLSEEKKEKQFSLMVQSLLAQRYHLKVHFEMREMPAYELHVAKEGLKLKQEEGDDQPGPKGTAASSRGVKMGMEHATMGELTNNLSVLTDRPVVDKTMVSGRYTFQLLISPVGTNFEGRPANRNGQPFDPASDAPSIFEAMKDLGLELVPVKGPVEVVVVDSIDHPSEN